MILVGANHGQSAHVSPGAIFDVARLSGRPVLDQWGVSQLRTVDATQYATVPQNATRHSSTKLSSMSWRIALQRQRFW